MEHGTTLSDQLRGAAGGHPAVAVGDDAFEHLLRHAAEKDGRMGLLHRPWEGAHERKIIVGAVIFSRLIGPECLHGFNGLPRLRPAVSETAPHNLRLFFVPASTDAK